MISRFILFFSCIYLSIPLSAFRLFVKINQPKMPQNCCIGDVVDCWIEFERVSMSKSVVHIKENKNCYSVVSSNKRSTERLFQKVLENSQEHFFCAITLLLLFSLELFLIFFNDCFSNISEWLLLINFQC